jgi:hypothetical protein
MKNCFFGILKVTEDFGTNQDLLVMGTKSHGSRTLVKAVSFIIRVYADNVIY